MAVILFMAEFTTNGSPNSYTDQYPNNLPKYKECLPRRAPFIKLFRFPVSAVVHATHTEEKSSICQKSDGMARFKANLYSRPALVLKKEWQIQPDSKEVLPGKYVWFSMKPTLPNDPEFEKEKENYNVYYVNWKANFYGPWSFTFDYNQLISTYQKHIRNHTDPAKRDAIVVLRKGGTLMYTREICYIVIVTHSKDTKHNDEEYPIILPHDDVLTISPLIFQPRCVPPPLLTDIVNSSWYGYDCNELTRYDHVVFAVNCDWSGEVELPKKGELDWMTQSLTNGKQQETASPIFKIQLSPGEPHNYFEDCKDASEESYESFHPHLLCHRAIKRKNWTSCYLEEYRKWISTEMPTKIREMAKNVGNSADMMEAVTERDDRKARKRKAVDMANEVVESASKCCKMTEKIIELEEKIDDEKTRCVKNVKKEVEQIKDNITNRKGELELVLKAENISQMALEIAQSTEDKTDDDFAKKAKKFAEKKSSEAEQLIGDIMEHVGEMAGKMDEMAEEMGRLERTQTA